MLDQNLSPQNPETLQIPQTPHQAQQHKEQGRKAALGCGIFWLIIVVCFMVPVMLDGGTILSIVFAVPFLAVGVGLTAWGVAPAIRAMKITPPEIHVSSDAVRLGETFDFRFHQEFKDKLHVDFARAEFVMRETAIYRRGTDTCTVTHEIPVETREIPAGDFESGERLDLSHRFTVPPDGMHTFIAPRNRIEWVIKVKVSIARWPDVNEDYPIQVLPEQYRGHGTGDYQTP